jgi:methionyl aminopeptidase
MPEYLDTFRVNGKKIAKIREELVSFSQTHPKKEDIEAHACDLIKTTGGEPAFKKVPGYHWATCINVNSQIVHAIPKGYLNSGDLVTIDTGMYYQGTTSDCATSFIIGEPTIEQQHFLDVGKRTLEKAIAVAQPGNRIRDISETIQKNIEKAGYNVVRTLTGHGIGKTMHESPMIPCFVSNDPEIRTVIKPGMVLAIEVMYMVGDWPLIEAKDGWSLSTADGSLSAVFEDDIIVTPQGPEIITR